jgi:hypothetical protein
MNKGVGIVEKYEERSLYPMLLKFYHHLHLVVKFEREFVEQIMYANYNLDFFEMVARTSEPSKFFIKRKLLISNIILGGCGDYLSSSMVGEV